MDEIFDICTTKIVSAEFISIHFISLQSISIEQIPFQSIPNHYKPFQLSRFHFKPFQSITIHFNSSKTASGPHAGPLLISPTNLDRKKNSSLLLAWFEMDCNELKWRLKWIEMDWNELKSHLHIVVNVFQFKEFHKSNSHPKGGGWALGSNLLLKIISTHSNLLQFHFKLSVI